LGAGAWGGSFNAVLSIKDRLVVRRAPPDGAASRKEVRGFIAETLTEGSSRRGARRFEDADRDWSRKLGEAGYAGLTWPKEYGGAGAPYSHQAIFLEELARAEAPSHPGLIGLGMAGPPDPA